MFFKRSLLRVKYRDNLTIFTLLTFCDWGGGGGGGGGGGTVHWWIPFTKDQQCWMCVHPYHDVIMEQSVPTLASWCPQRPPRRSHYGSQYVAWVACQDDGGFWRCWGPWQCRGPYRRCDWHAGGHYGWGDRISPYRRPRLSPTERHEWYILNFS